MAQSGVSLEELYSRITLEEEEDGGVIMGNAEEVAKTNTFVIVGKFLTEKNINFNAMQNVMASLWRPKERMEVHDLGEFRFSFVFYHILDMQKVLEGGPWSFEQSMMVCCELGELEDPRQVKLQEADIWVQVYDITKGLISEKVLESVGDSVRRFIKADPANFDGRWKEYVCVRIAMNIEKPIKRMKLKRDGNNWSWIHFKYERISSFCFVCGIMGHSERVCNIVYANPEKTIERAYGSWLRAPNRGNKVGTGARWLRNVGDGDKK